MGRGPTDLEQKMGLSRDLLASTSDNRCPRFGETSYNEKPGRNRALMVVAPTMRSWDSLVVFLHDYSALRRA
jgi:hypothetical protein